MEKEINKIKKEYFAITPPEVLLTNGIEDIWYRADHNKKQFFNTRFSRIFAAGIIIFLILSGVIGISSAYAKPGSILYPVKVFTKKVTAALSKVPISAPEKTLHPTVLLSPTPTSIIKPESENEKSEVRNQNNNPENKDKDNSISKQNQKQHRENPEETSAKSSDNTHDKNNSSNGKNNNVNSESRDR